MRDLVVSRSLIAILALLAALFLAVAPARAEMTAHVFWQVGCPYCEGARELLREMAAEHPDLVIDEIELGPDPAAIALFERAVTAFGVETPAVPLVIVGDRHALGFAGPTRTRPLYQAMIDACRAGPCPDRLGALRTAAADPPPPDAGGGDAAAGLLPETISLPLLGDIDPAHLSLPLLTVALAAVDGFNPCAMWVLALLIGLLLGVSDSRRMWLLGAVFLLATGAMYLAVMAAWLNVVLWLGAVAWLRLAIGILAVGAGGFYLREYWTNPEGLCKVTPGAQKRTIRDAFRRVVEQPSLLLAALGVAGLAIVVNLVELVCSAGVPAVFTQVLAMQEIPAVAHYGYLLLYIAVFLFDDAALLIGALVTLRAAAATGRYTRLSHLLGGIVLIALGAVMILRPDLLG